MSGDPISATRGDDDATRSSAGERNGYLDILRAAAILMVIAYHVVGMYPDHERTVSQIASFGRYGVDLFFVLSGWLIGGLYWREQGRFGGVDLPRFWIRRWTRTLPPYFAALALSWIAVFATRREPFDPGYLVFLQNYYLDLPFFQVSWSICVEEHFYLLAPFVMALFRVRPYQRFHALTFALLLLVPLIGRAMVNDGDPAAFGFSSTATHLNLSGLVLGVALSWVHARSPEDFARLARMAPWVVVGALVILAALYQVGGRTEYIFWNTAISVLFAAALAGLVPLPRPAFARLAEPVALASYSLYLLHPLAIHAARELLQRVPAHLSLVYFPIALTLVGLAGAAFYFGIERTSIELRDRYWPRRQRPPEPLSQASAAIIQAAPRDGV